MKAEKEHIDELIVSYLSNELDGNAVHELKEWIAAWKMKSILCSGKKFGSLP